MTVYSAEFKTKKILTSLMLLLCISSIFFGLSHFMVKGNNIKFVVLAFMAAFVLVTFIGMLVKRVKIEGNTLFAKNLMGTKQINLETLCGVSVINMKGRILCILSDDEKYVFVSSLFDGFTEIINRVIEVAPESATEQLKTIDAADLAKKSKLIAGFLLLGNIFLLGLAVYNII